MSIIDFISRLNISSQSYICASHLNFFKNFYDLLILIVSYTGYDNTEVLLGNGELNALDYPYATSAVQIGLILIRIPYLTCNPKNDTCTPLHSVLVLNIDTSGYIYVLIIIFSIISFNKR